jgi:hypothetical protein
MVYLSRDNRNPNLPTDDTLARRYHVDLNALGVIALVTEDLVIRRRGILGARPSPRDIERLAGIAARVERGAA